MKLYRACSIVEGFSGEEHSDEDTIEAMQSLIDRGMVWQLQGFYGRLAMESATPVSAHSSRNTMPSYTKTRIVLTNYSIVN